MVSPHPPILRDGIPISICTLYKVTILRIDPLDTPLVGCDIEGAAFASLRASNMDARGLEVRRDHRSDAVARLEPLDLLLPHQISTREPVLIPVRAAMLTPASRNDGERFELAHRSSRKLSYTQGVEGMSLLDAEPCAIPPRASAAPSANGHPEDTQGLHQFVSRGVAPRRTFPSSLSPLPPLHTPPFGSGLAPLGLFA